MLERDAHGVAHLRGIPRSCCPSTSTTRRARCPAGTLSTTTTTGPSSTNSTWRLSARRPLSRRAWRARPWPNPRRRPRRSRRRRWWRSRCASDWSANEKRREKTKTRTTSRPWTTRPTRRTTTKVGGNRTSVAPRACAGRNANKKVGGGGGGKGRGGGGRKKSRRRDPRVEGDDGDGDEDAAARGAERAAELEARAKDAAAFFESAGEVPDDGARRANRDQDGSV